MDKIPFKAQIGQVDYTDIRWVPVFNCVVMFRGKMLLLLRSRAVGYYPGYWNGVSGFLDDHKSLAEKAKEELWEELGIKEKDIKSIKLIDIIEGENKRHKKTWIIHALTVELLVPDIKLNWENDAYVWIDKKEVFTYRLLPGFHDVLACLGIRKE